jgi:TatD DNase family protein
MSFIDAHCHLHDTRIIGNIDQILTNAAAADVRLMATCATMEDNFKQTQHLAQTYPMVVPFYGIHPWYIDSISSDWKSRLETQVSNTRCGVGEIGLDFADKKADRERQLAVFEHQLNLANALRRPVSIHIRKAWDSFIHILKRLGPFETPGLIHSYSGSPDMIPVFERYGLYISFSGSVTHPNSTKGIDNLNTVSCDRFVLETDTPDIPPYIDGIRLNTLNEPANLQSIAAVAAKRLGKEVSNFCDQAFLNSLALFAPLLPNPKQIYQ